MKVILFGATGMVGQGVLRECLLDPNVEHVLSIVRSATGQQHVKLTELIHKDFLVYSTIESQLTGYDTCCFCLGVSSSGMSEESYSRVTYDIPMAAARTLVRLNPSMTLIFISGAGTDSTEKSRTMWARVKGKTENALLRLPFRAAYMFRPGLIEPRYGVKSKTAWYRIFYALSKPLLPLLRWVLPNSVLTTDEIGRAMLTVAKRGASKRILESKDIRAIL